MPTGFDLSPFYADYNARCPSSNALRTCFAPFLALTLSARRPAAPTRLLPPSTTQHCSTRCGQPGWQQARCACHCTAAPLRMLDLNRVYADGRAGRLRVCAIGTGPLLLSGHRATVLTVYWRWTGQGRGAGAGAAEQTLQRLSTLHGGTYTIIPRFARRLEPLFLMRQQPVVGLPRHDNNAYQRARRGFDACLLGGRTARGTAAAAGGASIFTRTL